MDIQLLAPPKRYPSQKATRRSLSGGLNYPYNSIWKLLTTDAFVARPRVSHPIISPTSAFSILLVVRLLSAVYATIPDCDEGSYLSGLGSENVADYFSSL